MTESNIFGYFIINVTYVMLYKFELCVLYNMGLLNDDTKYEY